MSIYLIRHGETPGNRDRIVQRAETPLSERGLAQAARLAERLRDHPVARILASDLARADMTARKLSEATGRPVESEPLLQERNLGDIRGTPYAELDVNPFEPGYAPPGGETWEAFHARVDRAWARILACRRGACAGRRAAVALRQHGALHRFGSRALARRALRVHRTPLGRPGR
jgi:broad specificity phosphatase PhoE